MTVSDPALVLAQEAVRLAEERARRIPWRSFDEDRWLDKHGHPRQWRELSDVTDAISAALLTAHARAETAEARLREAVGLLRECEWIPDERWPHLNAGDPCPVCDEARGNGHEPDCKLAAFLAAGAEGK